MANPFKGMGGGGGLPSMQQMMQIQKKLMEDAEKMQDKLDTARLEGSAGGGTVKAVADGQGHLLSLTIQKEAIADPDDVEILQDMVLAAVQEALTKAEELRQGEQQKMMPNVPGLPGLF